MGNFNTPALLFGLILLVASIALFLFGRFKPELQRDSDNVYAVIGVVCSLILFASAFELSLGMSFQQLLLIGSVIALMWENIKARQPRAPIPRGRGSFDSMRRGFASEPARRGGPLGDNDRPGSGVYRYETELDEYDRYGEPRPDQRRIRGSEPRGYEPYDERSPLRPRPSLNEADRSRGRSDRDPSQDWGGREDWSDRPARRPLPDRVPDRAPDRASSGPASLDSDWADNLGTPSRRPNPSRPDDAGFGPDRTSDRGRPPRPRDDRPRDDRSMEGRPIGGRPLDLDRPLDMPRRRSRSDVPDGPGGARPASGSGRPPGGDRPPLANGSTGSSTGRATGRPPVSRPGPGDGAERSERSLPPRDLPPRRPPAGNRPPIDVAPITDVKPLGSPPRPQPSRPLDLASDDDYVDFKPVTPPPADEFDNSNQFDD